MPTSEEYVPTFILRKNFGVSSHFFSIFRSKFWYKILAKIQNAEDIFE